MEPGTRLYGESRLMEHRAIIRDNTNIGRVNVSNSNNQDGINASKLGEYEAWERALLGQ